MYVNHKYIIDVANFVSSKLFLLRIPSAMNGRQHSSTTLPPGVEFPGAGDTFHSFANQRGLPQITLSQSFILAAIGIEVLSGKLLMSLK